MYENEPKLLCNYPISGCVGVMASIILVAQVFSLLFTSSLLWYLFEMAFCFFFVFILSMGVRQRKLGLISTYCLWLCIYIFWAVCSMILYIYWGAHCNSNPKACYDDVCAGITPTSRNWDWCQDHKENYADQFKLKGTGIAALVILAVSYTISLLLCVMQLRFCFLLYRFIQQETRTRTERQVTYQSRPANSPPTYSQETAPWPEKPPGYAEALSAAHQSPTYTPAATPTTVSGGHQETPEVEHVQRADPFELAAQSSSRPDPFELDMTPIDLNETAVLAETPIYADIQRGAANSLVPEGGMSELEEAAEASSLSVTNPFKDEVERVERHSEY